MSRRLGLIIAIVSAALLAVSVVNMTARVKVYNARAEFPQQQVKTVTTREMTVWDRPLRITDAVIPLAGKPGASTAAVKIEYGDQSVITPIKAPLAPDLPKLVGYAEWLAVLEMKEFPPKVHVTETTPPTSRRVVVVKRNPAEGYDPDTWGSVRRADWTFDFFILTPEGKIEHELWRFPRSDLGERGLANRAKAATDPADPEVQLFAVKPLEERSWEYSAALFVIPALQVPKYKFKDDAVSAMGWTLPLGMFSALAFTLGVVFAAARGRTTPDGAAGSTSAVVPST